MTAHGIVIALTLHPREPWTQQDRDAVEAELRIITGGWAEQRGKVEGLVSVAVRDATPREGKITSGAWGDDGKV